MSLGKGSATAMTRVSAVLLLALIALLTWAPSASAAPSTLWQRCDGGEDDVICGLPRGVAAAPATSPFPGHVYVAAQLERAVFEFTPWGEFVRSWGWDVIASGPGNNGTGFEICVPANGDVCKKGVEGSGAGQFATASPQGLAIDSAGNVYVFDRGIPNNARVQKFDPEGHFLLMFGGNVNKTKVDEGAPEAQRNVCTAASGDVCQAGTEGIGNGQVGETPVLGSYIAVAPGDKVYVGDVGRIQRFDTGGVYQGQINLPGPTEKVRALTARPTAPGTIYAAIEGKENVLRWNSSEVRVLPDFTASSPQALAVNAAGNVFVVNGSSEAKILRLSAAGALIEEWGQEEPPSPKLGSPTGIAAGAACIGSGTNVYVSNPSPEFLRAYGPAPDKLASCPRPAKPPTVVAEYALSVSTTEASLGALINPHFWDDATYQVQYGTAACIEGGGFEAPCAQGRPASPAALGTAHDGASATTPIQLLGLTPNTEYRYRFVTQSGAGGPVAGAEKAFQTAAPPSSPGTGCANEILRAGAGAFLADCRAYEMVSPVDKAGGDILLGSTGVGRPTAFSQSATDGAGLAYSSIRAFGDSVTQPEIAQYIARRGASGWSSHGVSPARGTAVGGILIQQDNEFKLFSKDLCEAWLVGVNKARPPLPDPNANEGAYNLYRRQNCGAEGYEALGSGEVSANASTELQGVSGDGSRTIFRSQEHLSQDAAVEVGVQVACRTTSAAKTISFQWLADGASVGGATNAQYTTKAAEEGKTLQCRVTLNNENAGSTQVANPAWIVKPYPGTEPPEAPNVIAAPSSDGPLAVGGPGGQTLGCNPGQWSGSPSFEYRWYRNGAPIGGASEPTYLVQASDLATPAAFQCEAVAANPGGKVVKASENLLTSPAPADPAPPAPRASSTSTGFDSALYESFEGQVRSVCLLPGTKTAAAGCSAGSASGTYRDGRSMAVVGAMSQDGQRVFWSDTGLGVARLYLRDGATQSVQLSSGVAQFWGASTDGSTVIFGEGADLFSLDVDKAIAEESGAKTLIAHQTSGVVGMSEDAGRIYLVSKEALSGGQENSEGAVAQAGQPNLYLYEGGGFTFVGTLSTVDARVTTNGVKESSPVNKEPFNHSARVTADGGTAAFMASASLTGYDNSDANNGIADAELFRYEAAAGQLVCVSCKASGARPGGRNLNNEVFPFWAAAWIPGSETELYFPRPLSEDGKRLFFNSFDPLVLRDTNGKQDVYEWEAVGTGGCEESAPAFSAPAGGCVSLISSGDSPLDSEFLDASPSGDDVFFRTGSSLVSSDPGQVDVYDARVGGGFAQPTPRPSCEGDACQSPAAAPEPLTPASSVFRGPGDLHPKKPRCAKGKRRVMRNGKARCVKKGHKKNQRRASR